MALRPFLLFFLVALVVLARPFAGWGQSVNESARRDQQIAGPQRLKEPAGASRCQVCHPSELEGYARSAMAHSLRRASQEPDGTVQTQDAKITIHSTPSGYWQRLESGSDVTDYRIDYVIGSGNHAAGYLLDVAGHLFQSPVAYYKSRQAYDLAPGYEGLPHPDFTRPIAEACLFCHAGSALKISGTSNQYYSPPFAAEAITCERCHGSAERHLSDPRAGTIINPAKLDRAARDSICEQCHLLGVGRVLNPGKNFGDFRPGESLEEVFTTYCNVSPPGADAGKFKVISHVEQLARSKCARMSNGQLWCGTCHDPHDKPVEPVAFFRARCLSCHRQNFAASHPGKDSNCMSCHMPRRDAKDGGHTAFTDHRIQRRPQAEESLPGDTDIAAWREPPAGVQKRNLGIAYINVGLERRSRQFIGNGYRMLTEVQEQFAADSEIFTAMGSALLVAKQTSEAELAFERAVQLNPKSVSAETNAASAYLQAGDVEKAIAHLERATAIDPLHLPADAPLINLYKQQGNVAKAAELSSKVSAAMEGQPANTETGAARSGAPAESVFKNIQILTGIPSDQLIPAMRFMASSLGVECGYCHVEDHFDRDDKKPKQIARQMIRMMATIDSQSFAGNREVTCYSCHRGSVKPVAIPMVAGDAMTPSPPGAKAVAVLPATDELIDKYVQALGGRTAIEGISSRAETGFVARGKQVIKMEIVSRDPGKRELIEHRPAGDAVWVFNGHEGWSSVPGHPMREMNSAEFDAAQIDADLHFPLRLRELFSELRVEYPEQMGDREAFVLSCANVGRSPMKFYFDEQSGLLLRQIRYASTPLGVIPTQIDYDDYRQVDGVMVPFRRTVAEPDGIAISQLDQVRQNVAIDDSRFARPVAASGSR